MRNKRCMAFAFAFIFAFIALAVPRSALAYEYSAYTIFQNEWYEDGDIDPTQGWIIYANNKYDAALFVCGDNVSNLTDEQLNYLSDPNYGGAFYSLAQKFGTGFEHEWIPDFVRPMLALVDFDKVQVGTATTYEISQAKARLQEVMNGDFGSGGGGSGEVGEPIAWDTLELDNKYGKFKFGNSYPDVSGYTINLNINSAVKNKINSLITTYPYYYAIFYYYNSNRSFYLHFYMSKNQYTITHEHYSGSGNNETYLVNFNGEPPIELKYQSLTGNTLNYTVSGNNIDINWNATYQFSNSVNSNSSVVKIDNNILGFAYSGNGALSPVQPPSGDWPSAPVEPSPPELPTPTNPVEPVEPEPTIPDPTIPSDPIYIPVEAPDSTDYTDWLRAILEALNAIDDDLVTFASNVGDYFSAQNTFLRQIINEMATHCDHLQVRMHEEFAALTDYLNDLFTWLAGQMEYNFEGYDDTSVIGWLRKIYGRLGGGTYEPNPQADTPSFLDWLRDLWQRFFDALIGVLPSAIGDLVNDFQQLTRFFPFSIPWDLAALLGLFAHSPVTPVFDIPLPFGAGAGQTTSIHVDCTPWDGVAAMIRPCFLAMFCLQLALLTRDLLKGLNVTNGGGD